MGFLGKSTNHKVFPEFLVPVSEQFSHHFHTVTNYKIIMRISNTANSPYEESSAKTAFKITLSQSICHIPHSKVSSLWTYQAEDTNF